MHNKGTFDTDLHRVLAENVKKLREKGNYSQSELAIRANISSGYIGMIEQGQRFPGPDVLERLAAALNVEPNILLVDVNKEIQTAISNNAHSYSRIFAELLVEEFTKALKNKKSSNKNEGNSTKKKIIKLLSELEDEAADSGESEEKPKD